MIIRGAHTYCYQCVALIIAGKLARVGCSVRERSSQQDIVFTTAAGCAALRSPPAGLKAPLDRFSPPITIRPRRGFTIGATTGRKLISAWSTYATRFLATPVHCDMQH